MNEFQQRQMDVASVAGDKSAVADANTQVQLAQGQVPTIDHNVYEPSELVDNGYSLSNPVKQPNRHTKEGAMIFGGRDAHDGQTINPTTEMPSGSPQTNRHAANMEPIYKNLAGAQDAFTIETGIAKSFEQLIKFTNSLADDDPEFAETEANHVRWAMSDDFEQMGFDLVSQAERTEEGINDQGLHGITLMMASQMMRGAEEFEQVINAIGDTGANDEQLEEAWNKAQDAYNRAGQGVVQNLPTSGEEALSDPRYLGASAILSKAIGKTGIDIKDMSEEQLRDEGMLLIDMIKGNPLILADVVMKAKKDPQIADAINFLLAAEEEMPTTWGDFGRGVGAAALDPTSYLGIGLAAKAFRGTITRQALKAAGLTAAEGAVLGGSYMGLMDYGFQNVDVLAGKQDEISAGQVAGQAGIGASLGFLLGGAISGLSAGAKALLGRMRKPKPESKYLDLSDPRYNVTDLDPNISARQDFEGVPLPVDESLAGRRAAKDARDQPDLDAFLNPEEDGGMSLGYVEESEEMLRDDVEGFLKKLNREDLSPEDTVKEINRLVLVHEANMDQIAKMAERDPASLARANLKLVDTTEADELLAFRREMEVSMRKRMDEKIELAAEHADDFRFTQNKTVTSKHSGKKFKILERSWDEKNNEPRYFVEGPEGETHYMSEWGMVGGKPKLEVVPPAKTSLQRPDAELIEKEYVEYPQTRPGAQKQAATDRKLFDELMDLPQGEREDLIKTSPKHAKAMDQSEPWIGVINDAGEFEFKNRKQGEDADWHHSMAIENIDDWDDDSSITFIREFTNKGEGADQINIKGDAALDPLGKGKKQIKELATKLKEAGMPGNFKIKIEEMGLHTDYEGQIIGTIDEWIRKR